MRSAEGRARRTGARLARAERACAAYATAAGARAACAPGCTPRLCRCGWWFAALPRERVCWRCKPRWRRSRILAGRAGAPALGAVMTDRSGHRFRWLACPGCGCRPRWVRVRRGVPEERQCRRCAGRSRRGPGSAAWKGGRYLSSYGYVRVRVDRADPLYCMTGKDGYVPEHRLVVARRLGRPLTRAEHVHHVDGDKLNNDGANLVLVASASEHQSLHQAERRACRDPRL
jgi:HNH endonuclease